MVLDTKKIKTEWDLSLIQKDASEKGIKKEQTEFENNYKNFISKWKDRKDYLTDSRILKEALDDYEMLMEVSGDGGGRLSFYMHLKSSINLLDTDIKAQENKISKWATDLDNDLQFFPLSIARIPHEKQNEFLGSAILANYKHFLEACFRGSEYLLSDAEEKILNLKSETSYSNWKSMLSSFLSKEEREIKINGKKSKKSFSEISSLISDSNKKTRDEAASVFNEILAKHSDVAEHEMNSILAHKKTDDDLRKIPRPDLIRHIADDMDSKTVDVLVDSVRSRFDIPQEYYKLKAKLLGVKKLQYHERLVKYGSRDKKYSFDEASKLIYEVFGDLHEYFASYFKDSLTSGRVDVYPRKGKRDGAFCTWHGKHLPVYVLLNYTGKLRDLSTIAHEFGHAINGELSKKQNSLQFNVPISTTEVASTFMEDFVLQRIEKEANDELKLSLIMERLDDAVSTIFRQVACYELEKDLHESFRSKGYLSKDEIGKIFLKHMESYLGSGVELSKGSENWWIYWSHIRNYFYVYSYASGLLISKALQKKVKENPSFINKVVEFMSSGSSLSPRDIFLKMGIDMEKKEFWDAGLAEIDSLLKEAKTLAKKLKKIK